MIFLGGEVAEGMVGFPIVSFIICSSPVFTDRFGIVLVV